MPQDQIRYQHGTPIHFITTRNFTFGNTPAGPLALSKGTDVFFDGTTAEVAGARYAIPQLRGAIRTGWLVVAQRYDENDTSAERPRAAGIEVRHAADGGNPLRPNRVQFDRATEEDIDEREVGHVDTHARETRDRNIRWRPGQRRDPEVEPGRRFTGSVWNVEPQDGVEVRRGFATSRSAGEDARSIPTTQLSRAGEAIAKANNVQIQPGEGITEEQMLERMSPEDREMWLADKEADRSRYVEVAPPPRAIRADPSANRVVARVENRGSEMREGMTSRVTTGGGTEVYDVSGLDTAPARQGVLGQEGLTFRTTNGPERAFQAAPVQSVDQPVAQVVRTVGQAVTMREAPAEIRKMVAKTVCPDFPDNYDFSGSVRKRLARLQADYEDRSDVLRAVFAAEGDEMKSLLVAEFPQAFATS